MTGCNCNKKSKRNYNVRVSRSTKSYKSYNQPIPKSTKIVTQPKSYKMVDQPRSYKKYNQLSHLKYGKPHQHNKMRSNLKSYKVTYKQPYDPKKDESNPYRNLTASDLRSWDKIHNMAAAAVTPELKEEFERYMKYLQLYFPCGKCRPHIKQRLITKKLEYYNNIVENGKDIGYAKWSWEFHNEVNARLNKSEIPWNTFKNKYLN